MNTIVKNIPFKVKDEIDFDELARIVEKYLSTKSKKTASNHGKANLSSITGIISKDISKKEHKEHLAQKH